jgi:hypothetical protein
VEVTENTKTNSIFVMPVLEPRNEVSN